MATRTFKVYGQAYSASGDVSVVMTVGGTEVFNGAVSDSTTVREGQPTVENHLWTYEMDENVTGELAVSIAVTGGELCLGPTHHNLKSGPYIPIEWFTSEECDKNWSAADQTYMSTHVPQSALDSVQSGLYDKLVAGTATAADNDDFFTANMTGPGVVDEFEPINDIRDNLAINGDLSAGDIAPAATDEDKASWWPIVQDSDTLTYTWVFDPDSSAF